MEKGEFGEILNLDPDDYSGCIATNFPFVIERDDDRCKVHDVFTGIERENSCENGTQCCVAGKQCEASDCIGYKAIDTYLVDGIRKYSCDNGRCIETEPGKGEYTNPYCDYECINRYFPKIYDCVDGVCLNVGRDKGVYNNPECDAQCDMQPSDKYKCVKGKCVKTDKDDKKGQYYAKCFEECEIKPDQSDSEKEKQKQKKLENNVFIVLLIITLIIFAVIYKLI